MDTVLDCVTYQLCALGYLLFLCLIIIIWKTLWEYTLAGSLQGTDEAASREAPTTVPDMNIWLLFSHIRSAYFYGAPTICQALFWSYDALVRKTIKDICCPRANILVKKLDNEQGKEKSSRVRGTGSTKVEKGYYFQKSCQRRCH